MRKLNITRVVLTLGAVASVVLTNPQSAQADGTTDNTTADINLVVVRAISITKDRDMDFGEVVQDTAASVVAPADGGSAEFTVDGEGGYTYDITLPNSVTLLVAGGTPGTAADEIVVNTFTSTPNGSGTLSGALGAAGSQTLNVGATRAATPITQNPGVYSGQFTVTVTYN